MYNYETDCIGLLNIFICFYGNFCLISIKKPGKPGLIM